MIRRLNKDDQLLQAFVNSVGDCCQEGKEAVRQEGWRWAIAKCPQTDGWRPATFEDNASHDAGIFWIGSMLVRLDILNPPWAIEQESEDLFDHERCWGFVFDPHDGEYFVGSATLRWAFPISLLKWGVREWDRLGRPNIE